MRLFKYEGYNLTISEEAFLLKPFKAIWNRDKSKGKQVALQELGFIYFMEDPRSDYKMYIDKDERAAQIIIGEGIKQGWKPDKLVNEALEFYASFKSDSALLLEDLKKGVQIIRKGMVTTEDIESADPEKKPKMLKDYSDTIAKLADLAAKIDDVERRVAKEIVQSDRVRGSQEKSMYEDI